MWGGGGGGGDEEKMEGKTKEEKRGESTYSRFEPLNFSLVDLSLYH